jgi:hypothetical protein
MSQLDQEFDLSQIRKWESSFNRKLHLPYFEKYIENFFLQRVRIAQLIRIKTQPDRNTYNLAQKKAEFVQ